MDDTTKKILEIVTDIQENGATKDDIKDMATKDDIKDTATKNDIMSLHAQIKENTNAIAEMAEQLRGVFGYAKEIDALMTRMSAVEKHVGISR